MINIKIFNYKNIKRPEIEVILKKNKGKILLYPEHISIENSLKQLIFLINSQDMKQIIQKKI